MSNLISKQEFQKMRDAYASKHPKGTQSVTFERADVLALLNDHPEAAKLKVWLGKTFNGQTTVMLMPVNTDGAPLAMTTTTEPPILDRGQICPPYCS
jgi:hypothetical protein